MPLDTLQSDRGRPRAEISTSRNADETPWAMAAAVLIPLLAAGVSAISALWCLAAGLFGDPRTTAALAFGLSTLLFGACAVLAATERRWPLASWLSPVALLSTVAATSAVAGQNTGYGWGLAVAAAVSASASTATLLRSVVAGRADWSPALVALGVVASTLVALLNPTPRPLPTDAPHAQVFIEAYRRDFAEALKRASTARLTVTTSDGLLALPQSLCHIAARCEVKLRQLPAGDLLFVPTYISWRNEYAGGLIRWTADGPPPALEVFTATVTPVREVGDGWWWSEPR